MFSSAQLLGLCFVTLFVVYAIASKILDLIRFNKYAKMWMKYYETIKSSDKWYTIPKPGKEINKKEEKEDERNVSGRNEGVGEARSEVGN